MLLPDTQNSLQNDPLQHLHSISVRYMQHG